MTIQEAVKYSVAELKKIYEEGEASAISDWLMEHLTGHKKSGRLFQKITLSVEQVDQLNAHLKRLLLHEPIQYVLNETWFCGLKFYVDKRVLIPRPETEELVEWIITNCRFPIAELSILDIGTGSGCIPIALKRRLGKADVCSIDISQDALEIAHRNAGDLGVEVDLRRIDFLAPAERNVLPSFDVIVSNPPYIPNNNRSAMQPNVLAYEPGLALFVPDNNALLFYEAIAEFGKKHLNPHGAIYMEIHEDSGEACASLFNENGYVTEIKKDMQGKDRMLKAEGKVGG